MPKSVYLTPGLLQCCTLQGPKCHFGQITVNTEHVCTLSAKKIEKGQYLRVPKTTTLAACPAENRIQATCTCV